MGELAELVAPTGAHGAAAEHGAGRRRRGRAGGTENQATGLQVQTGSGESAWRETEPVHLGETRGEGEGEGQGEGKLGPWRPGPGGGGGEGVGTRGEDLGFLCSP